MFEVLKGKNGESDCYINLDSIQFFYTYTSSEQIRTLKIHMSTRAEVFLEKYYDIDDFVNKIKDRYNL